MSRAYEPISCQFCGEDDFDLIGLKAHLLKGGCAMFEAIETVQQERDRLRKEKTK